MKRSLSLPILALMTCLATTSCKKEGSESDQPLKNDLLKKTTSPAVVGERIEFVYALGTLEGVLLNATAEASIAGGPGTGFSRYSWFTNRNTGVDQSTLSVSDSTTDGSVSTASLLETNAVSLRYYYTVPEEARGQKVSFTFRGTSSAGQTVSFTSPAYQISRMDMKRLIPLRDGERCYVSIADMAAYTKEEVSARNLSGKIDFVYIYRPTVGAYTFGHALVALSNNQFTGDLALPASWTRPATLIDKRIDVKDAQLRGTGFDVYIDDIDLERTTFTNVGDYAYSLAAEHGAFIRTTDGTTAYVFVNSVNNTTRSLTMSIKKLAQ